MTKKYEYSFNYRGVKHIARSLGDNKLPNIKDIIAVHALPITSDGKIMVVNVCSRGIDMMGGHVEPHETSTLQTLLREVNEEAQITVKDIVLIDVLELKSKSIKKNDSKYLAIYTAHIDLVKDFMSSNEISERLILDINSFAKQYFGNAPEYIKHLYNIALKKLQF